MLTCSVENVPVQKKRYYLIGIGGIAMSNLACFLKEKGHTVAGSDIGTFEPALSLLRNGGIRFWPRHMVPKLKRFRPDTVIVGNAIVRGNVLLEYVLNENIPYLSLPEVIRDEVIAENKAIVITGTSGKTTTTALTSWILHHAGLRPSAFIGGIVGGLGSGYLCGRGGWTVVEGDEYSSSFYDKRSKFLYYRPYIGLVNNIGRDHVDLFPRVRDAVNSFRLFSRLIPSRGRLLLNRDDRDAASLADVVGPQVSYFGGPPDLHATDVVLNASGISFTARIGSRKLGTVRSVLMGQHNVNNIVAAMSVARAVNIPIGRIAKAIESFQGVKRRLETIYEDESLKIIDDFGHNPVKVRASLSALRAHFPKSHVVAVFEPRTASSRRTAFQRQYPGAFAPADTAYIAEPFKKELLRKGEQFSSIRLVRDLNRRGIRTHRITGSDDIVAHVLAHLPEDRHAIIAIMSSGDFGGIRKKMVRRAQKKDRPQ